MRTHQRILQLVVTVGARCCGRLRATVRSASEPSRHRYRFQCRRLPGRPVTVVNDAFGLSRLRGQWCRRHPQPHGRQRSLLVGGTEGFPEGRGTRSARAALDARSNSRGPYGWKRDGSRQRHRRAKRQIDLNSVTLARTTSRQRSSIVCRRDAAQSVALVAPA